MKTGITSSTQNIVAGLTVPARLTRSQPLGVIYGAAGLGKTSLIEAIRNKYGRVVWVRAREAWRSSRGMMLRDILSAINPGWGTEWSSTEYLYRTLLAELKTQPDLYLLIDESDYLARGRNFSLLHTLRDLADEASVGSSSYRSAAWHGCSKARPASSRLSARVSAAASSSKKHHWRTRCYWRSIWSRV